MTAGHVIFLGNSLIKWQLKQQDLVTLSTTEAEFVNFSTAGWDLMWVKQLVRDAGIPISKIPLIGTDSVNTMKVAKRDQHNLSCEAIFTNRGKSSIWHNRLTNIVNSCKSSIRRLIHEYP